MITVAATAAHGRDTGCAQTTVVNEGGGTTVLDVPDARGGGVGTDNGPGVSQAAGLNSLNGPAVIQPVTVP